MQFNSLPPELIRTVLWSIPNADNSLETLSLVCRTRVAPDETIHLECLLKRFINADNEPENDLATHVQRLHLYWDLNPWQLETFGQAVSKMKNLEELSWIVVQLYEMNWYNTLVSMYRQLPKLWSLELKMLVDEMVLGDSDQIVPFSSLRKLSVEFGANTETYNTEIPNTHIEIIRGAHNIESLCLNFEDAGDSARACDYSVSAFSKLAQTYFPNLRDLDVFSAHLVPIDDFSGPGMRQFIQNHNQLQKFVLHMGEYYDEGPVSESSEISHEVTPVDVEEMMPSIRYFGGPGVLVAPILSSPRLAQQLETLEFHEPPTNELVFLVNLPPRMDNVLRLPTLKTLGFYMHEEDPSSWTGIINVLSLLAPMMPVLCELVIWPAYQPTEGEDDELVNDFLRTIGQISKLSRLKIYAPFYSITDGEGNKKDFYEYAKALYPSLDVIERGS